MQMVFLTELHTIFVLINICYCVLNVIKSCVLNVMCSKCHLDLNQCLLTITSIYLQIKSVSSNHYLYLSKDYQLFKSSLNQKYKLITLLYCVVMIIKKGVKKIHFQTSILLATKFQVLHNVKNKTIFYMISFSQ